MAARAPPSTKATKLLTKLLMTLMVFLLSRSQPTEQPQLSWTGGVHETSCSCSLLSSCGAAGNWFGWCNKEFDDLMKSGAATYDPAERQKLYKQAIRTMVEDAYTGVSYIVYVAYAMNKRVKSFNTSWTHIDAREMWLGS